MCSSSGKKIVTRGGALAAIGVLLLAAGVAVAAPDVENNKVQDTPVRTQRSSALSQMLACGWDGACFVDRAENFLVERRDTLLAEADKEAVQITGRADSESSPSGLSSSIANIISELTEIFKGGITGLFRDGKDDDDEEAVEDDDEDDDEKTEGDEDGTKRNINGDLRGHKKKKKKALIKLFLLGLVLKAKLTMLLKVLAAHLQVKFLLIALAGLLINAARFYFDLKKSHHPQKVIYYEHAQHQHHYDHDDHEDWSGGGGGHGGGYWGRSYAVDEDKRTAQEMAYAKQAYKSKMASGSSYDV